MKKFITVILALGLLCVFLGGSRKQESCEFSVQYIRTNGYNYGIEYPVVTVIRSVKELQDYYGANKSRYDLERKTKIYSDTTIGFLDACDKYTDDYFKTSSLVLILLEEGSGSFRHEVLDVSTENDKWNITIEVITPEACTSDMAEWHIFLEIQSMIDENDTINVSVK